MSSTSSIVQWLSKKHIDKTHLEWEEDFVREQRCLRALLVRPVDLALDTKLDVLLEATVRACGTAALVARSTRTATPCVSLTKPRFSDPCQKFIV